MKVASRRIIHSGLRVLRLPLSFIRQFVNHTRLSALAELSRVLFTPSRTAAVRHHSFSEAIPPCTRQPLPPVVVDNTSSTRPMGLLAARNSKLELSPSSKHKLGLLTLNHRSTLPPTIPTPFSLCRILPFRPEKINRSNKLLLLSLPLLRSSFLRGTAGPRHHLTILLPPWPQDESLRCRGSPSTSTLSRQL